MQEVPREACQGVEIDVFRKVCNEVQKTVPRVSCSTRMREIELKEICVDIDIQLAREECKKEEREECKFVPRQVVVQKCDPTVREVCQTGVERVCRSVCQ